MILLLLIALLAAGIPTRAAGSAFVNCLLESSVARLVASDAAIPVEGGNASPEACSAACATKEFTYSLFGHSCACGGEAVTTSTTVADVVTGSNEGICPLGTYTLAIASTPWSFMACGPAPRGGDVTSYPPGECLARCPSTWAMVQRLSAVSDTEEKWSCMCLALASCPNEKCSASDAVYYHRPMPTRRRRSQLPLKTGGEDELCPAPMVACAVGEEGWECIDTRSELESCGGCVRGVFGQPGSAAGHDCATLRGVSRGGTRCVDGRYEVTPCRYGFRLGGRECIPW